MMKVLSQLLTVARRVALLCLFIGGSSSAMALESRTICGQTVTSNSYTGAFPAWLDGSAIIYRSNAGAVVNLGLVSTDNVSPSSILNQNGLNGSPYQANSIFNAYGTYGSAYSSNSACNPNASYSSVPQIWRNGSLVGYLTTNTSTSNRIDPATLVAAFLAKQASLPPPISTFSICNQSNVDVAASYARLDTSATTFVAHGWYNISAGTCQIVSSSASQFRYYYVYAEGNGVTWQDGSGANEFCVDPVNSFDLANNNSSCASRGYVAKNFVTVDTGSNSGFTFNLTGSAKTAPTAVTSVIATAGPAQATVSFTSPANTGGSPVTGYTVTSYPAGGVDTNAGTTALSHTITGLTNGTAYTFTVVATNGTGNSAASASSNSVTPMQISQSISFGAVPTLAVGGTGTVTATGGASGNVITFTSTTPTICSVAGSTVTVLSAGSCVVAANQAGNANYNAAPQATQTIAVGASAQNISFGAVPTLAVGGTGAVTATGGASGNVVTFASTTPTICTVAGSTVTALTAGSCVVAANQSGNANYSAAPQATQTIAVGAGNTSLTLLRGWNLLGNSQSQPLPVATTFGDKALITTVWKWDTSAPGWQFYTPGMTPTDLQTYTVGKGYGVLSVINPGEGYWVNATAAATLTAQSAAPFNLTNTNLLKGWNLVATGNDVTPSAFNTSLNATPPAYGLTTLWAWDNAHSKWYFYAPNLAEQGGAALTDYINCKGYLDFTTGGKTLGAGVGFWVNKP
jgi:uncharacterized membrane protein